MFSHNQKKTLPIIINGIKQGDLKSLIVLFSVLMLSANSFSQASFTMPDTVCVNDMVNIQNTTPYGSYYSWNFCVPDVNNTASAANIGNPGNLMNVSVFSDIVVDSSTGNYFMFVTSYTQRNIVRLDFGTSPLNAPTATNLGTFGGMLPPELEGIQIAKDSGNWYGFVVGGQSVANAKLVRLNFGTSLSNAPTATNLGNIGSMQWPTEYQLIKDGANWLGVVANRSGNRISVHNFGPSLTNTPTGSSYVLTGAGNGSPCNLMAIKEGANWHVFVTCLFNSVVRLDYGTSLLNVPTQTNFGTLNGALNALPRAIIIIKDCNKYVGYLGHENGTTLKLNFNSGLTGPITTTNLGNLTGTNQKIHEYTPITHNGNLYIYTADYGTNTIQRMSINFCASSPVPASNNYHPPAYSYGTPGIYDVSLIVDEGRGIPGVMCKKITVVDKYNSSQSDTICAGNTYTLPGGAIVSQTGIYSDTLISIGGCDSIITTNLTVSAPVASISSFTNVTCNGLNNGTATATVAGGIPSYSYSWNTSPAQTGGTSTGLAPGTYTVTVTDAFNCTSSTTVSIAEPTVLLASITSSDNATCNGLCNGMATAAGAGGTPNYSYSWNSNPIQTTANANNLCAGTYTCTVSDANNCTATITVTITEPTALNASATGTNVSCNGGNNGTATVTANGGTTTYLYSWSTAPAQTGATASNLTAGTYTVTVTDANNCTATASVTITQPTLVTGIITSTNVTCNGLCNGTATVTANGGTPTYTYSWNTNPAQTTAIASGLCSGTYTVTITDNNSCTNTATISISQPTTLTANSNSTNVLCNGGNSGTATAIANGGRPNYSYSWNSNPVQTNANATGLIAGSYTCTVTDVNGCTASTSVAITEPTTITLVTSFTPGQCDRNNNANVVASGGTPAYAYSWNTNPSQTTSAATNVPVGTYVVTVTDANGCSKTQTLTIVNASITPTPGFNVDPTTASILYDPVFNFTDNSSNGNTWFWDFGDGTTSNAQHPSHTYSDTGTYCITQVVTNMPVGCMDSITKCVRVDADWTFYVPNAFSPNGNGLNDTFGGKGTGIKSYKMLIFDRWGNQVFESNSMTIGWDGRTKDGSEKSLLDVYVYVIDIVNIKNVEHRYTGHITLVR